MKNILERIDKIQTLGASEIVINLIDNDDLMRDYGIG